MWSRYWFSGSANRRMMQLGWEVDEFHKQFPDFNLEDKVVLKGEEIDRADGGGAKVRDEGGSRPSLVYRRGGWAQA